MTRPAPGDDRAGRRDGSSVGPRRSRTGPRRCTVRSPCGGRARLARGRLRRRGGASGERGRSRAGASALGDRRRATGRVIGGSTAADRSGSARQARRFGLASGSGWPRARQRRRGGVGVESGRPPDRGERRSGFAPGVASGSGQGAACAAALRPSGSRCATASNSRIDPATAALSEPTAPRIGIRIRRSQRFRTAGPRPWPSLPTTSASGPRRSAWRAVSGASASEPATRRPAAVEVGERRREIVDRAEEQVLDGAGGGLDRRRASAAPGDGSGRRRRGRRPPRRSAAASRRSGDPRASRARARTAARRARSLGRGCRRATRTRAVRRPGDPLVAIEARPAT